MAEVWPRRASKSRRRSRWATISAWAAHGVAAQISGGRGRPVSPMLGYTASLPVPQAPSYRRA